MFPADSPLAALSVTWGTLRGQAVLALAGSVRMGRGQGPDDCGWALACVRTDFGKEHCIRSSAAMELSSGCLCFHQSPIPVSIKGLQVRGHTDVPGPGASGLCHREGKNTKASGGGTWQVRFQGSSPGRLLGRGDQAKETHVQMLRLRLLLSPSPRRGNGGYKMEL